MRRLCEQGRADSAVSAAFNGAVSDTIRVYGLEVPTSCTPLEFLSQFLRPDMGSLRDLLGQLYRLYEPSRFGRITPEEPTSVLALTERIYSQTPLARAYDPLYQPAGPPASPARPPTPPFGAGGPGAGRSP